MHLGNGLSALISWLDCRRHGGEMIFRLEDLDPQRSRSDFSDWIQSDLKWLGLDWDEGPDVGGKAGPYCQDARRHLYEDALEKLRQQELVYPCACTRNELHDASAPHVGDGDFIYPGHCAHLTPEQVAKKAARHPSASARGWQPALRLRVPQRCIHFTDLNYGPQSQNLTSESGDFVLRRSDGVHAYQLAVSVDDALMGITRVVRGQDLLSSTGRQILIHELLGFVAPEYGHVPLVVGQDGRRLSKRHFATDFGYWRERGLGPESIVGYLAWRSGLISKPEALKAQDLVPLFSWERLAKAPIVISEAELNQWLL